MHTHLCTDPDATSQTSDTFVGSGEVRAAVGIRRQRAVEVLRVVAHHVLLVPLAPETCKVRGREIGQLLTKVGAVVGLGAQSRGTVRRRTGATRTGVRIASAS